MRSIVTRRRGFTVIEVALGSAIVAGMLLAGSQVLRTSADSARSTQDVGIASTRVHKALQPVADRIRRASLAEIEGPGGVPFTDGATHSGIRVRLVEGWDGAAQLSAPQTLRFDLPLGAAEGEIILEEGPLTVVIATGVTSFDVTRSGTSFTVRAGARSGPADDRGRGATGQIVVRTRNP